MEQPVLIVLTVIVHYFRRCALLVHLSILLWRFTSALYISYMHCVNFGGRVLKDYLRILQIFVLFRMFNFWLVCTVCNRDSI